MSSSAGFKFAQPGRTAGAPAPPGKILQSAITYSGYKTQHERYTVAFHGGTSTAMRRSFPELNYAARGAPKRNDVKITTFGYQLNMVPEYGKGGIGVQHTSLVQQPRPRAPHTRVRYDAYMIRPQRSLSVQDIMAGKVSHSEIESMTLTSRIFSSVCTSSCVDSTSPNQIPRPSTACYKSRSSPRPASSNPVDRGPRE